MAATDHANGALVELEGVSKVYEMGEVEVRALDRVDLRIAPGEYTAIVGPSGSGKSTLLNLIGCLDLPSEGTYRLRGEDVTAMGDRRVSRLRGAEIGFVFQNYSLLNRATALQNVEMPHYYLTGHGNRKRALELLDLVGLSDRAKHRPTELSGGQQQRVAVARALMNDPILLLADEPTGNLDSHSGQALIELLERLNTERGLTIIVVTHDPDISARARRVIHVADGHIVSDERQNGDGHAARGDAA
jgi:putative ABC transport system ATP-binding protein